jgi:hypothetical protein
LEAKEDVIEKYKKNSMSKGPLGLEDRESGSLKYQNLPEYAAMI